ncbi:MAG TPA: type IV toxin-antitoxin system AbiEi family antitoxin domain-containing protein [Arthrobacter sp.]|nr:type IV toxin-antitoxin system AbiEi family antitoxin domain-containing protein [Arthrobacter sp.]
MADLSRLILTRDHPFHGLTPKELARRAKSGELHRVRQGVYIDGATWAALKPWEQYRVKVGAAAEVATGRTIFGRHSAASVWRIPFIGFHHPVEALTLQNDGGRSRPGVSRHYANPDGLKIYRREGLLVTGRIRTVLDLAAFTPFVEAIVPLDHVLKPDKKRNFLPITKEALLEGIGDNYTAAAIRRIRVAVDFADPLSGSPGESYSRALIRAAGFEAPVLQQEFRDGGGLIGYSDFYWKGAKVAGEFDGIDKYLKPEFLKGRTAAQAVIEEKIREDRIRATGCGVVRWVWPDLMVPGLLERRLAEAGVPRRRPRSSS